MFENLDVSGQRFISGRGEAYGWPAGKASWTHAQDCAPGGTRPLLERTGRRHREHAGSKLSHRGAGQRMVAIAKERALD